MDTVPLAPGVLHPASRPDDFRIADRLEIAATLQRLADARVHVGVNAPNGSSIVATVWAVDAAHGVLSFSIAAHEPRLDALVECNEAVVVGYLDSVKLQFDADRLVLVRNAEAVALKCEFPGELYRFQRRNTFRVRPMLRSAPVALLRHPSIADMRLELRVLDVSIGGCALFLPDDVPAVQPGTLLHSVVIALDADTRVHTGLQLHHVTSLNPQSRGVRLGCELVGAGPEGLRSLQRYIDQTQKRRRLLSLD